MLIQEDPFTYDNMMMMVGVSRWWWRWWWWKWWCWWHRQQWRCWWWSWNKWWEWVDDDDDNGDGGNDDDDDDDTDNGDDDGIVLYILGSLISISWWGQDQVRWWIMAPSLSSLSSTNSGWTDGKILAPMCRAQVKGRSERIRPYYTACLILFSVLWLQCIK